MKKRENIGPVVLDKKATAIVRAFEKTFDVCLADLRVKDRHTTLARMRQVLVFLLREDARVTLPELGRLIARDHTTVLTSIRKVHSLLADGNRPLAAKILEVRSQYIEADDLLPAAPAQLDRRVEIALRQQRIEVLSGLLEREMRALADLHAREALPASERRPMAQTA